MFVRRFFEWFSDPLVILGYKRKSCFLTLQPLRLNAWTSSSRWARVARAEARDV